MGRVGGVHQGQRLRKCPTLDLSTPIPKGFSGKVLGAGKASLFWGAFLFVFHQAAEARLLPANRAPGNSSVLFYFCLGCQLLGHLQEGRLGNLGHPVHICSQQHCLQALQSQECPFPWGEFREMLFTNQSIGWLQITENGVIWKYTFFFFSPPTYQK